MSGLPLEGPASDCSFFGTFGIVSSELSSMRGRRCGGTSSSPNSLGGGRAKRVQRCHGHGYLSRRVGQLPNR